MSSVPKLSICIPTYNRAHLLESALLSLEPQILRVEGRVEVIVCDNHSQDETPEVVRDAQGRWPFRYYRNKENLGAARNAVRLITELAEGEFLWMLGDDDIVRPDGVARVLSVLEQYPEIDYVFVNTSPRPASIRNAFNRPVTGLDFPDLLPTKGKQLEDRHVEKWEELVDPDVDDVFLGSVMCNVYRLSLIKDYPFRVAPESESDLFSCLEYSYCVYQAYTMVGRRAYYIGYPCTIAFWGDQEWKGYVPLLVLVRLQELLDLYRFQGVPSTNVEKCRLELLRNSSRHLSKMLYLAGTPGRKYFSVSRFLWRNRHHPITLLRICLEARRFAEPTRSGRFVLASTAALLADRRTWDRRLHRLRHESWRDLVRSELSQRL